LRRGRPSFATGRQGCWLRGRELEGAVSLLTVIILFPTSSTLGRKRGTLPSKMLDPLNESSNQPSPAVPSWPSSPHDPSEIPAHLSPTPSPTASRIMSQQQHYHHHQQRKTSGLGGASLSRQGSYRGGGEGLPAGPSGQPEGDYGRERQVSLWFCWSGCWQMSFGWDKRRKRDLEVVCSSESTQLPAS
jgi:hypothetical protein